jgi:hypothetical protein
MNAKKVLTEAANIMHYGGLVSWTYREADAHCMVGAVEAAMNVESPFRAWKLLGRVCDFDGAEFIQFSDAPDRTADEVASALLGLAEVA